MAVSTPLVIVSTLVVGFIVVVLAGVGIWKRWTQSGTDSDTAQESGLGARSPQFSLFDTDEVDDARAIDPRVLLPMAPEPNDDDQLVSFACSIKHRYGDEPVHLFSVDASSGDGNGGNDDNVRDIAGRHDHLSTVGAANHTAIQTEVSHRDDVAPTIVETAADTDADLIVMGWDATQATTDTTTMYGQPIDHILSETTVPAYLAQIDGQLTTTDQLHVVVPQHIDHHEGFYEAIYNVKQLASYLEASITVWVFERNVEHYRTLFDLVEIDIPAEFASVTSWTDLHSTMMTQTDPDDLVITLSVREGNIGWDSELETVPDRMAKLPAQSFALFFLRENDPEHDDRFLRTE